MHKRFREIAHNDRSKISSNYVFEYGFYYKLLHLWSTFESFITFFIKSSAALGLIIITFVTTRPNWKSVNQTTSNKSFLLPKIDLVYLKLLYIYFFRYKSSDVSITWGVARLAVYAGQTTNVNLYHVTKFSIYLSFTVP